MFADKSYRWLTKRKPFDDYSSRGSNVHAIKKYHRNMNTLSSSPNDIQLAITSADASVGGTQISC